MELCPNKKRTSVKRPSGEEYLPLCRKRFKAADKLDFCTFKSKLKSVVKDEATRKAFEDYVLIAHEAFAFFRLYCLSLPYEDDLPEISESTMKQCLNQASEVCTKDNRGARPKDGALGEKLQTFWKKTFCKIHPDKIDLTGKSRLKAILAEQMCSNVLVDCKTHFRSRLFKLVVHLLGGDTGKRREATTVLNSALSGDWENVEPWLKSSLGEVLPREIEKGSIHYNLKKSPEKYVACTRRLCGAMGDSCKIQFLPSRRSWVPCHVKFDTESVLQMFVPYKTRVEWRKRFGEDRKGFNDAVWDTILNSKKVDSKSRKFSFHHELSTDSVAVSLHSRVSAGGDRERSDKHLKHTSGNIPPGRPVGLDPGKKNILTMADENGNSLKYTACQRNFESKLVRYRRVLSVEKNKNCVCELETYLSNFEGKSNDPLKYKEYLKARVVVGKRLGDFYRQRKWRNLKFSIYCHRKSSEQRLLNRIADNYGEDCEIKFGNWSRKTQMKGCQPTPNVTLKNLLSKRFRVVEVDEFRTSITCNSCMGTLKSYGTRSGKLSRSRLCCESCGGKNGKPSKRFVDRDVNAALNILLVGTSSRRPASMSRQKSDASNRSVAADRTSSDPSGDFDSRVNSQDANWRLQELKG